MILTLKKSKQRSRLGHQEVRIKSTSGMQRNTRHNPPEDKMISIDTQETISKPEGRLVLHSRTNLSAQKQLFSYQIEKLNEEAHYQDYTESSNQ